MEKILVVMCIVVLAVVLVTCTSMRKKDPRSELDLSATGIGIALSKKYPEEIDKLDWWADRAIYFAMMDDIINFNGLIEEAIGFVHDTSYQLLMATICTMFEFGPSYRFTQERKETIKRVMEAFKRGLLAGKKKGG